MSNRWGVPLTTDQSLSLFDTPPHTFYPAIRTDMTHSLLFDTFGDLVGRYAPEQVQRCHEEIRLHYTASGRYYHRLDHLEALLRVLLPIRHQINDWDMVLFALYYHDIIYSTIRTDNEARSARFAAHRLGQMGLPSARIDLCTMHIRATRTHAGGLSTDTDHFTDADLSILGQAPEEYDKYSHQIRREYSLYPDPIYWPARKKILRTFLDRDRIYHTAYFFDLFEQQAKANLTREINSA